MITIITRESNPELPANVFMFRFQKNTIRRNVTVSAGDMFMILSCLAFKLIHFLYLWVESIDLSLLKFMILRLACLPSKFIWKKCLVKVQLLHDFISEH